jgi:hypothetical protein
VKNGILRVSLDAINAGKAGCFKAAFMEILKILAFSGKKIKELSEKILIINTLYPLLRDGFE